MNGDGQALQSGRWCWYVSLVDLTFRWPKRVGDSGALRTPCSFKHIAAGPWWYRWFDFRATQRAWGDGERRRRQYRESNELSSLLSLLIGCDGRASAARLPPLFDGLFVRCFMRV